MTFPVNQILGGCPSAGRLALLEKTVFLDGGRPPNTNHDDAGRQGTISSPSPAPLQQAVQN